MDFVAQNILLITVALISGIALLLPILRDAQNTYGVSPGQAVMLLNRQNAQIVDVRDAAELESGKIADARHIPLVELEKRTSELGKNKTRPIVLLCATGARSNKGVATLRKVGFEQVFSLDGGIKAWKDANQPIVSGKKA